MQSSPPNATVELMQCRINHYAGQYQDLVSDLRLKDAKANLEFNKLSYQQREQLRQLWQQQFKPYPEWANLPRHGGNGNRLRILLAPGGNGLGDVLFPTAIAAAMWERFGPCDIYLLSWAPQALHEEVYQHNPYIKSCVNYPGVRREELWPILQYLDLFDLIVNADYALIYEECYMSRLPKLIGKDFIAKAKLKQAPFVRLTNTTPQSLNLLSGLLREHKLEGLFTLAGYTGDLPLNQQTPLPFFIAGSDCAVYERFRLHERRYVLVHNGSGTKLLNSTENRSTKMLPTSTLNAVVASLKSEGYYVVQIGLEREQLLQGVDLDLRGATTIAETALLMKWALCLIDTEGGLVHLDRAMHGQSVTIFGPTPANVFGYPQNINLVATNCTDCWWLSKNWMSVCVRTSMLIDSSANREALSADSPEDMVAAPPCMRSHRAETIVAAAKELIAARSKNQFAHSSQSPISTNFVATLQELAQQHQFDTAALTAIGLQPDELLTAVQNGGRPNYLVELINAENQPDTSSLDARLDAARSRKIPYRLATPYNLPFEENSQPLLLVGNFWGGFEYADVILREINRVLTIGGYAALLLDQQTAEQLKTAAPTLFANTNCSTGGQIILLQKTA